MECGIWYAATCTTNTVGHFTGRIFIQTTAVQNCLNIHTSLGPQKQIFKFSLWSKHVSEDTISSACSQKFEALYQRPDRTRQIQPRFLSYGTSFTPLRFMAWNLRVEHKLKGENTVRPSSSVGKKYWFFRWVWRSDGGRLLGVHYEMNSIYVRVG